jgi:hypothetical protein
MRIVTRGLSMLCACLLLMGLGSLALAAEVEGRIDLSSLERLRAGASEVSEANLDAAAIRRVVENPELHANIRDVAKALTEVHAIVFEMGGKGSIALADLDAIRAQLKGPAWTRVLSNQEQQELEELYTLKKGDNVAGIVVLVAESKELTVVNLVGSVDPATLASLDLDGLGELGEAMVEGQVGGSKAEEKAPTGPKQPAKAKE